MNVHRPRSVIKIAAGFENADCGQDVRQDKAEIDERKKEETRRKKEKDDENKALQVIDKLTEKAAQKDGATAFTATNIRDLSGLSGTTVKAALGRLECEGLVEETKVETWGGKNNTTKKDAIGYRRTAFHSNDRTDRTDRIDSPFDGQSVRLPD